MVITPNHHSTHPHKPRVRETRARHVRRRCRHFAEWLVCPLTLVFMAWTAPQAGARATSERPANLPLGIRGRLAQLGVQIDADVLYSSVAAQDSGPPVSGKMRPVGREGVSSPAPGLLVLGGASARVAPPLQRRARARGRCGSASTGVLQWRWATKTKSEEEEETAALYRGGTFSPSSCKRPGRKDL